MCVAQLQRERDALVRERDALKAELAETARARERDQDEIAELQDRVGNLRVQAQSKLVRC